MVSSESVTRGSGSRHGWMFASFLFAFVLGITLDAIAEAPKQAKEAQPAQRYWQSQWEFEDVDVGKLASRLKSIGIDLGLELQGDVTVKFDVGIPLTALTDGAAYRFDGKLSSPKLTVNRLELERLQTEVTYRNGLATLTELKCSVADAMRSTPQKSEGKLSGSGTLQLVPQGDATASLDVQSVGIAPLSNLIADYFATTQSLLPKSGQVSGNVQLQTPIKSIQDVSTYTLDGTLTGVNLAIGELPPANVSIDTVMIRRGVLDVSGVDVRAQSNRGRRTDMRFVGKVNIPLTNRGPFKFEIAADDLPMTELTSMLMQQFEFADTAMIRGKLDFQMRGQGELVGNLDESRWNIGGAIASPSIRIAGVDLGSIEHDLIFTPKKFALQPRRQNSTLPDRFQLQTLKAEYRLNETSFNLTSIAAEIFGGTVSGSASLPRDDQSNLETSLSWSGIRPQWQLKMGGAIRPTVQATLAGNVQWQVPAGKFSEPVAHLGTATMTASDLSIGEQPVGQLNVNVAANSGDIYLKVAGELFGGTVKAATNANLAEGDGWSDLGQRLQSPQLQFDAVSLSEVLDVRVGLLPGSSKLNLTGQATGQISIETETPDRLDHRIPPASVTLELLNVNHQSRLLSRRIKLNGRLEQNTFRVQSLVGDYAGGTVRSNGRIYLLDSQKKFHPRVDLRLSASRVKLDQGLWFFGEPATQLQGLASITATIGGYTESVRGRGSVSGRELAAYGIPIGTAHSALVANANLNSLKWGLTFPSIRSSAGGGQIEGELMVSSARNSGFDLSSRWKTRRVDFFRLTNQIGRSSSLARGEISGEMSLRGKSIRKVEDLSGRFDFQLGRTRGSAFPGLIAASQFLGPVSIANQSFDVGQAKGVIGKGSVVIDEFWIGADNALVQADGKVNLRSGRMNLNVLIATGDFRDIAANFTQLAQRYALRSLLPTSAIISVTELLRDRTVVLAVLGTAANPIVRLRPIETFREEAARFLLREGQRLIVAGIFAEAADELDGGIGVGF